ncbi:MAG: thiamine pyrophosphate-dependent enzyme [Dehalococcoidia bacterium]
MQLNLRVLTQEPDLLAPGHRLCPGCMEPVVVRQILQVAGPDTVVITATGCLEVSTTPYPYTAWRVPWLHSLFENAGATIAGVEAAGKAWARKGKLNGERRLNLIAFAGDGGTYDIGLQSLSGAIERGHRFLYVCLNNEAYMNTGIQRSSAALFGTWTTTSPVGRRVLGKPQGRKDLTRIVAAHGAPYVAQASPHLWKDLKRKVARALQTDGPTFINVLAPCPRGWRSDPELGVELGRVAVETCVWPIYEVDHGVWRLNHKPRGKKPVTEWLAVQGRFSHLLQPSHKDTLDQLQREVDEAWDHLLAMCERSEGRVQRPTEEE